MHSVRRRALETIGVRLPDVEAVDFLSKADARPLTALQASFYLALSHLPASFLPEVVGVHYASTCSASTTCCGAPVRLAEGTLRASLAEDRLRAAAEYGLARPAGAAPRRLTAAVARCTLEREHVTMLGELARWRGALSLDGRVAQIVRATARSPAASTVTCGSPGVGCPTCSPIPASRGDFVRVFRASLRCARSRRRRPVPARDPVRRTDVRGLRRAGGGVFKDVGRGGRGGRPADIEISPCRDRRRRGPAPGRPRSQRRAGRRGLRRGRPRRRPVLFHRLVNIETHPNTLRLAAARVGSTCGRPRCCSPSGPPGGTPTRAGSTTRRRPCMARVERIYFDKLVGPYRPLRGCRTPTRSCSGRRRSRWAA